MTTFAVLDERQQESIEAPAFHQFVWPSGVVWTEFHRRGAAYLLRFPGLADFDVSADGTAVTCSPAPGTDPVTIEHLYNNQVLPLALSRQGRLAFHASAVTVPGGTVAFLGRTGLGKSTLAAQFARSGASFLTDDGLLLAPAADGYLVLPNHPSIRLWDDSHQALLDDGVAAAPPVSFTSKSRFLAGDGLSYCDEPQPLRAAYVLDDPASGDIVIRRTSMSEAVMGWLRNSFLLDVEDPAMLSQHFQHATAVAHAIPTYHLDYPRLYERLAEVQAAILRHLLTWEREERGNGFSNEDGDSRAGDVAAGG
jgi:hypothetical protein